MLCLIHENLKEKGNSKKKHKEIKCKKKNEKKIVKINDLCLFVILNSFYLF